MAADDSESSDGALRQFALKYSRTAAPAFSRSASCERPRPSSANDVS
jgi:hypothetical protein